MARYFIVGAKGDSERWLIDTLRQEVQQIDAEEIAESEGDDSPIVKGIAIAIAAENRNGLTSHQVAPST